MPSSRLHRLQIHGAWLLGAKLAKLATVKALWSEQSKQKVKMTRRAILNNSAEELVSWLKVIPALATYASLAEEKGITGAQMLEFDSDQPLIDLGIESDIDRSEAIPLGVQHASIVCGP